MAVHYDQNDDQVVVIIGSGAGGGTLGNELAQKGINVLILEAGARHEYEDFVNDEWASFIQLAWKDIARIMGGDDDVDSRAATLRKRFERAKERLKKLAIAHGLISR